MATYNQQTPTKVPPDIDDLYNATPMLSVHSKIPDNNFQDKQEMQKSLNNLATILSLMDVQIGLEKDSETLMALIDQKANLTDIFIQKKSGKKGSLKTAEKETIQKLQNQISCLEKSVDKKFEAILKSIESNKQPAENSWAQLTAQNLQKEQTQQTASVTEKVVKKQSQKQVQKQVQKQDHDSYQAKRLILHVRNDIWKTFNSYNLRNQINDSFMQQEQIANPVVASVTRSRTGVSVVLTTMPEYNADFLLEKQQIWEKFFSSDLKFVEKSTVWHKIVVHGVPILPFSTSDGLSLLREEIETFNSGLKLLRDPNWLSTEENRQNKRHGSIVFAIDSAEQAQKIIKTKMYIAGMQLIAESYKSADTKTQCQKCQRLGHSTKDCLNQECCQICAGKHYTRQCKCHICGTIGVECPHTKLKCRNCGKDHRANNQICSFWEKSTLPASVTSVPPVSSVSPAKSDIAMGNSSNFAVVIPYHV